MKLTMLSTIDNPHSPFDNFEAWHSYDVAAGHHTTEFLGRMLKVSHELTETDYNAVVEQTIDEIVEENISGMFVKVTKEVEEEDD